MADSNIHDVDSFDARVEETLARSCCLSAYCSPLTTNHLPLSLGVGVSGGADSTALLVSVCHIARRHGFDVHVITVNHNIREESETAGDAQSVADLCARLAGEGYPVACTVKTYERGKVKETADIRGNGEEEAARYLRYEAFDQFAIENALQYIALAHNKNDQIETVLMRFLTGGSAGGMPQVRRGRLCTFVRPMLSITRRDIESYLAAQGIGYRTDSTNSDTKYLRNRMRHLVMPMLDTAVPLWREAVLTGAMREGEDNEALAQMAERVGWENTSDGVRLSKEVFEQLPMALKRRVILKAFNLLGVDDRVPHQAVSKIAGALGGTYADVVFTNDDRYLCAKKTQEVMTDYGFCVTIESVGSYRTPLGTLYVNEDGSIHRPCGARTSLAPARSRRLTNHGGVVSLRLLQGFLSGVRLPLLVRSRDAGDEILTARGTMKSIARIMSDWKVSDADRERIPIVEAAGQVVCIWGGVLGYKDYRVKGC